MNEAKRDPIVLWRRDADPALHVGPVFTTGYHLPTDIEYRALPVSEWEAEKADTVADIYRFLAQQFAVMDTSDLAQLVDGDRTNPIDVLRGVREALRLYGIIPLRKADASPQATKTGLFP